MEWNRGLLLRMQLIIFSKVCGCYEKTCSSYSLGNFTYSINTGLFMIHAMCIGTGSLSEGGVVSSRINIRLEYEYLRCMLGSPLKKHSMSNLYSCQPIRAATV